MAGARKVIGWALVPLAIALLLAACGGGSGSGSGGGEKSVFEDLLGTIPDTLETRHRVVINDYTLARQLFGVSLPGPDAGEEELLDYISDLVSSANNPDLAEAPFISGFTQYGMNQMDRARYLGFELRNVDQSVKAGLPGGFLEVIRGRFDPEATDPGGPGAQRLLRVSGARPAGTPGRELL